MAPHDKPSAGPSAARKFRPDGTARHFRGNTIISFVAPDSPEALLLARAVDRARPAIGDDLVLLPATSWHMTVFELLCDDIRDADRWSSKLALDAPLELTDEFFARHVPTVDAPSELDMTCQGVSINETTLGVQLVPTDAATADSLHRYRTELSEVTGIRFPDHDGYGFHITLAYTLRPPTPDRQRDLDAVIAASGADLEGKRFTLPAPVLTYFADMTRFVENVRPDRAD